MQSLRGVPLVYFLLILFNVLQGQSDFKINQYHLLNEGAQKITVFDIPKSVSDVKEIKILNISQNWYSVKAQWNKELKQVVLTSVYNQNLDSTPKNDEAQNVLFDILINDSLIVEGNCFRVFTIKKELQSVFEKSNNNFWHWLPNEKYLARTGEKEGVVVRKYKPNSKSLVIYLRGGGACINRATCKANPKNFDQGTIGKNFFKGNKWLNEYDSLSPFNGWNAVVLPYVSGDWFTGNSFIEKEDWKKELNDLNWFEPKRRNQYNGYNNFKVALDMILDAFNYKSGGLDTIVVYGVSAGGIGAFANTPQVSDKLTEMEGFVKKGISVKVISNGGILFTHNEHSPKCLSDYSIRRFNVQFHDTLFSVESKIQFLDDHGSLLKKFMEVPKYYPDIDFALASNSNDWLYGAIMEYGKFDCGKKGYSKATKNARFAKQVGLRKNGELINESHRDLYFNFYGKSNNSEFKNLKVFIRSGNEHTVAINSFSEEGLIFGKWLQNFIMNDDSVPDLVPKTFGN